MNHNRLADLDMEASWPIRFTAIAGFMDLFIFHCYSTKLTIKIAI